MYFCRKRGDGGQCGCYGIMVVEFTATYPISATNVMSLDPTHADVDSIKHYMIKVNYCFYAVLFNLSHEIHT